MSKDKKYPEPEKGEPWSSITAEELEINGFEDDGTGTYIHPRCPKLGISFVQDEWGLYHIPDKTNLILLKKVNYMYQIDNMFHGFTDRWLGLI